MKWVLAVLLGLGCMTIHAENLGVFGTLYPIEEPDMLSMIHQKLEGMQRSGALLKMEQQVKRRVQAHAARPPAVAGIGRVKKTTRFYFTPTVSLQHAIYDANGKVLFPAGIHINVLDPSQVKKVNPYAIVPHFDESLLFIDADDSAQVSWAMSQTKALAHFKIILVKGNVVDASNHLGRVYFDQKGVLCRHFGIKAVPAMLKQVGTRLQITEYALGANHEG